MNRTTMIATVMGMTRPDTDGAATLTPSTAESTEMAGVIMLSPKNSEAPKIPSAASTIFARLPAGRARRRIEAIRAMTPPSQSLSARITSRTYVTVTMVVTDQKISETIPKMVSCDTVTGCGSPGLKTVCTVYSGLVPMSPKTTPRAPTARAPCAVTRPLAPTVFASCRQLSGATLTNDSTWTPFASRPSAGGDSPSLTPLSTGGGIQIFGFMFRGGWAAPFCYYHRLRACPGMSRCYHLGVFVRDEWPRGWLSDAP